MELSEILQWGGEIRKTTRPGSAGGTPLGDCGEKDRTKRNQALLSLDLSDILDTGNLNYMARKNG